MGEDALEQNAVEFNLAPYLKVWGGLFREARKQRGLTVAAVARLLGIDPSSVSRFELGDQPLSLHYLVHYTRLLGLPPWLLFVDNPRSPSAQLLLRVAALPQVMQRAIGGFLDALEQTEDTTSRYSLLGVNY